MVKNNSFHDSVRGLLAFGQLFGMLPVINISSKNEHQLKFSWRSFRTIYASLFLILGSIEGCLASRRILVIGFSVAYAELMLFFIISMVRAAFLFQLAMKWQTIMKYWRAHEEVFLHPPYKINGWSLKKKLTTIFVVMIIGVFGDTLIF